MRRSTLLPDPRPTRRFLLHSRRARGIAAVALLVGGASLAAVSAGAAVLDGETLGDGAGADAPEAPAAASATTTSPEPLGPPTAESALAPRMPGERASATTPSVPTVLTQDADDPAQDADDPAPEPVYPAADGERIDAERIRTFLAGRGSPLAAEAETFVAAGIAHDVDPRVVVGIAIAESNGGERLPAGSHNAWGWGGSGSHGLAAWGSWEESIHDYTERLGERYDTDGVSVEFARTYCPPNWRWWHDTVTWAVAQI